MEEGDQGSHVLLRGVRHRPAWHRCQGAPAGPWWVFLTAVALLRPPDPGRPHSLLHGLPRSLLTPSSSPHLGPSGDTDMQTGFPRRVGDPWPLGRSPDSAAPCGSAVSPAWSLPGLPAGAPCAAVPASPRLVPHRECLSRLCTRPICTAGSCLCLKLIGRLAAAFPASALRWAVPDSVTALLPRPLPSPVHTRPVSGCREPSIVLPWSLIHMKAG